MRIKPIIDFAEKTKGKMRLFLVGKSYTVTDKLGFRLKKERKVRIRKIWYEGDIKCTIYE